MFDEGGGGGGERENIKYKRVRVLVEKLIASLVQNFSPNKSIQRVIASQLRARPSNRT